MELADAILVNKADGENVPRARHACAELKQVLRYLRSPTDGWEPTAETCSAQTGDGIPDAWVLIQRFSESTKTSGAFASRRQSQTVAWLHSMIEERLKTQFYCDPNRQAQLAELEAKLTAGTMTPGQALNSLFA